MQREEQQRKTDQNSEACNDVCHTLIKCRLNAYIPGNHCTHKSACVDTSAGDLQKTAGKMHFLPLIHGHYTSFFEHISMVLSQRK